MPRSSTPADRRTQATTGPAMWSSANLTTSTPHGTLSRLYHAACTLSVYASQPGSPPDHATLDSGWWPALTGQGSHLLGRVEGFRHVYPSTWLSPSPSFAWRNKPLFFQCWMVSSLDQTTSQPRWSSGGVKNGCQVQSGRLAFVNSSWPRRRRHGCTLGEEPSLEVARWRRRL